MDNKSLEVFTFLAQNLHFAKTAHTFFMSPSTLSRLIQRLEEQIGSPLLIRDNRSVKLTEAGQHFLTYAENQLAQWLSLKQKINQQQDQLIGKLHLYCSVTASYSHLPLLLDKFRQQHPLVEIVLTTGDAADAIQKIKAGEVDIGIAAKPDKLTNNIHFYPIAEIPLSIILPTVVCDVREQMRQKTIDWSKIPIIMPEHGLTRKRFESWYETKQQGKPKIYTSVAGHEALVSLVALGCGIGITPQVVVENSPVKNRVEYFSKTEEIPPFELGVCCLKQKSNQPIIQAFFNLNKH